MNLIPDYITSTVAKEYLVEHQQKLLRAWAQRFRAFCTSLPAISAAAISAGAPNIFTAGKLSVMAEQPVAQRITMLIK